MKHTAWLVITVILAVMLSGCQGSSNYRNSSAVEYLYPKSNNIEVQSAVPLLTLPLKVGIAFTPSSYRTGDQISESQKLELLKTVADEFADLDFVGNIEVIPSAYLRPGGSFDNLEQLRRMFGIDVIALVSYDQSVYNEEGIASIAYWTIVGAWVIPAEKNSTYTLLDAVVYDIPSRQLLFRAPGTSSVKSSATPVNLSEQQREDVGEGIELAAQDLATNLKSRLELFQVKVKESPEQYQVAAREGYTGTGTGSGSSHLLLVLLGLMLAARRWR